MIRYPARVFLVCMLVGLLYHSTVFGQDSSEADQAEEELLSLRQAGLYEDAVVQARVLRELLQADDPATREWAADTDRTILTLEAIVAMVPEARNEMAVADSLDQVVDSLWDEREYQQVLDIAGLQLDIRSRHLGPDHPETAATTYLMGQTHRRLKANEEAKQILEQALEIQEGIFGSQHTAVGRTHNELGRVCFGMRDFSCAQSHWQVARDVYLTIHGETNATYIGILGSLAAAKDAGGDIQGAEDLRRQYVNLSEAKYGPDSTRTALALSHLAISLRKTGKLDESKNCYERAVNIYRAGGQESSRNYGACINGLALVLQQAGRYAEAEPLLRQALAIVRATRGEDNPQVALVLNNLAFVLKANGNYEEAADLYQQAAEIQRASQPEDNPYLALTLDNLATLEKARRNPDLAEILYKEALAIRQRALGDEHPLVAESLNNLALLYMLQGEYGKAGPLLDESLAIRKATYGDNHPAVATLIFSQGLLFLETGDLEQAEEHFATSLAMREYWLGSTHPLIAKCLVELARVEITRDAYEAAVDYLTRAGSVFDLARLETGRGMARATAELDNPYPLLAVVQLELGRQAEAWRSMERARGRTLVDLLQATGRHHLSPEERERENRLHRSILEVEKRLAALARKKDLAESESDSLRLALRHELDTTEAAYLELQLEFSRKYPVQEGSPATLEEVQSALEPGTALVGWVEGRISRREIRRWGYSLTGEGSATWGRVDISTRETPEMTEFLDSLKNRGSQGADLAEQGAGIWSRWFGPLASGLAGVESLILVPSEGIMGFPVEALVDENGQYSGDRFTISYTPSATVYAWLIQGCRDNAPPDPRSALLLGDPPFSEAQLQEMNGSSVVNANPPAEDISRLASSRDEVTAIAANFIDPVILLGPQASEQALVDLAASEQLGSFDYIHLATHAIINHAEPRRSVLILSQTGLSPPDLLAEQESRILDGYLTPEEIVAEWDLAADLVVLSACETGLGRKVKQEGFIGFAHSFFQAGARGMLVSLWPVEDRSTGLLMARFYENLTGRHEGVAGFAAGTPVPARYALQDAKKFLREYKEGGRRLKYSHPYFWSPFILIGGN